MAAPNLNSVDSSQLEAVPRADLELLAEMISTQETDAQRSLSGDLDHEIYGLVQTALNPKAFSLIASGDINVAFDVLSQRADEIARCAAAIGHRLNDAREDARSQRSLVSEKERARLETTAELEGARKALSGLAVALETKDREIEAVTAERAALRAQIEGLSDRKTRMDAPARRKDPIQPQAEQALEGRIRSVVLELDDVTREIPAEFRTLYDEFLNAKAAFYAARETRRIILHELLEKERVDVELDLARANLAKRIVADAELVSRFRRLIERTESRRNDLDAAIREAGTHLEAIADVQDRYRALTERAEAVECKLGRIDELCELFSIVPSRETRDLVATAQARLRSTAQTRGVLTFLEELPTVPSAAQRLFESIASHRAFLLERDGIRIERLFHDEPSRTNAIGRIILIAFRLLVTRERGRSINTVISILTVGGFIAEAENECAKTAFREIKSHFEQRRFRLSWVSVPTPASEALGDTMLQSCRDPSAVEALLRQAQEAFRSARRAANAAEDGGEDT